MKLLLSNWGGFTELHMLNRGSSTNWSISEITNQLPTKTNSDLALKYETMDILLSIIVDHGLFEPSEILNSHETLTLQEKYQNMNRPLENIKSRADEIAKSFSKPPNNIESDRPSRGPYVSHLNAFEHMTNSKTGKPYVLDDCYILALMLINEAMRLKGEKAIAPTIEAMNAHSAADLRLYRDGFKHESTEKATAARHWKDGIVREYAEDLAKEVKENKPKLSNPQIRDKILPEVIQRAKEIGLDHTKKRFPETVCDWVRAVLKN